MHIITEHLVWLTHRPLSLSISNDWPASHQSTAVHHVIYLARAPQQLPNGMSDNDRLDWVPKIKTFIVFAVVREVVVN